MYAISQYFSMLFHYAWGINKRGKEYLYCARGSMGWYMVMGISLLVGSGGACACNGGGRVWGVSVRVWGLWSGDCAVWICGRMG